MRKRKSVILPRKNAKKAKRKTQRGRETQRNAEKTNRFAAKGRKEHKEKGKIMGRIADLRFEISNLTFSSSRISAASASLR
jgi:hypothetical protein